MKTFLKNLVGRSLARVFTALATAGWVASLGIPADAITALSGAAITIAGVIIDVGWAALLSRVPFLVGVLPQEDR